jgi:hypothetical protein
MIVSLAESDVYFVVLGEKVDYSSANVLLPGM